MFLQLVLNMMIENDKRLYTRCIFNDMIVRPKKIFLFRVTPDMEKVPSTSSGGGA